MVDMLRHLKLMFRHDVVLKRFQFLVKKLTDLAAINANNMIVMTRCVGTFVACLLTFDVHFLDQLTLNQKIKGAINRGTRNPELLLAHEVKNVVYTEVTIEFVKKPQKRETLIGNFPVLGINITLEFFFKVIEIHFSLFRLFSVWQNIPRWNTNLDLILARLQGGVNKSCGKGCD